jgi:hypothetical protein
MEARGSENAYANGGRTDHLVPLDVKPRGDEAERDAVAGVVALPDAWGAHAVLGHVHVRDARREEHVQHRYLPVVLGTPRRRPSVPGRGAVRANVLRFEQVSRLDVFLQAHGHRVDGLGERQLVVGSLGPGLIVVVVVLEHFAKKLHARQASGTREVNCHAELMGWIIEDGVLIRHVRLRCGASGRRTRPSSPPPATPWGRSRGT